MARVKHQVKVINTEAGAVPVWSPSSPSRPPTHGISVTYNEGAGHNHSGFCHVFAAKKFVDAILEDAEWEWTDTTMITAYVGDNTSPIKIKSDELEEIMEYDYRSKAEEAFVLPMPYTGHVRRIRGGSGYVAGEGSEATAENKPKRERATRAPREKKARAPRPSVDGMITAGQMADELGVLPRVLRAALRSMNATKPEGGWAWTKEEAVKVKADVQKEFKRKK